ncbi:hypothetical protein [Nocardiopsis sp. JB363]|uniref:hypothetical protein n=1 Tax=Nocardiopsis sp. JB363 TaxID=1434837 RepID=UPI00097A0960|nr:hypothetical protein [Nocardiopsis sp. JB363]SIO87437.1 hypothetical protein BQ8420_16505 [Nocardiopsis sp. JB363]
MLRNPWASPLHLLPLSGADTTDVTTVARQVWKSSEVEVVADHLVITTLGRDNRDQIARRLRTLGYVLRTSDRCFLSVLGRDADHPSIRALGAEELDERIAYLTALRRQITTANQ